MTEFTSPSRKGFIHGCVLVALYGLQQESLLEARHHKYADWNDHPTYAECKRLIEAIREGKAVTTSFDNIDALMAHTRQTLRVSYEEWEQSTPLTYVKHEGQAK